MRTTKCWQRGVHHCSGGMQGHGPSAGQLGGRGELCEAIGVNEIVLGENRALHPGWGTCAAARWLCRTCAGCSS